MPKNSNCCGFCAILTLLTLLMAGCGTGTSNQAVDKAQAAVEAVLDSWSRGEPPHKFTDPDQPIVVNDPDWKAGYRLLSFLSVESKQSPESLPHVRCRVALALKDHKGKQVDKEVVYEVQLGEKTIISRVLR
jgi:hypothetical protein